MTEHSGFQAGDTVRWKASLMPGGRPGSAVFTVTETGLESAMLTMPGEQLRVRKADGRLARVWASDIELVPGTGRGAPGAQG